MTSILEIAGLKVLPEPWRPGMPVAVHIDLTVEGPIAFDIDAMVALVTAEQVTAYQAHTGADGFAISWLPRGRYRLSWSVPECVWIQGSYQLKVVLSGRVGFEVSVLDEASATIQIDGDNSSSDSDPGGANAGWQLTGQGGAPLPDLSWRRSADDWFRRHFDHAAPTISSYMLGDSPLLKGRILDVGCGDGITDLGVFLRCQPECLVGMDPFGGFNRLPAILAENHLDMDDIPPGLEFVVADGNHIPYPDNSFDVVLSWGSFEHIAGGYLQTLREVKRVLKPDGLLFAHPGLYYSNFGHHLGEFTDEPFFHLTRTPEEVREIVFNAPADYMERAGDSATREQYWRWYNELNPITVASFEAELKAYEFDIWRVAIRTEDRIEYTHPTLQNYSMQDLATVELYVSAINRKKICADG